MQETLVGKVNASEVQSCLLERVLTWKVCAAGSELTRRERAPRGTRKPRVATVGLFPFFWL